MANLMNSYYYGKAGKADYTPDQLPSNRFQLFFEMLRIRLTGLIGVNLLYLLFCIPAIVWTVMNYMVLQSSVDTETGEVLFDFVQSGYLTIYLIGMVPCLMIAGLGATGEMYILRNWARDQHAFVLSDFKDALKNNWKGGLVVGLLNGLSLLLGFVCYVFYGSMASSGSAFFYVPQMVTLLAIVIWWMVNMVIFPMMVTYDMKLGQVIRNCILIVIARLPFSLLFLVTSVGIPAVLFLLVPYGILIGAVLYLLIGFSLTGMVYASYANSCFDKYLNPRIDGAQVGQGLRDPEYDLEDAELENMEDPNPVDKNV